MEVVQLVWAPGDAMGPFDASWLAKRAVPGAFAELEMRLKARTPTPWESVLVDRQVMTNQAELAYRALLEGVKDLEGPALQDPVRLLREAIGFDRCAPGNTSPPMNENVQFGDVLWQRGSTTARRISGAGAGERTIVIYCSVEGIMVALLGDSGHTMTTAAVVTNITNDLLPRLRVRLPQLEPASHEFAAMSLFGRACARAVLDLATPTR
jgi:hypothetical protein